MLEVCRFCAGDLGHSRSVSRRVRSIFFQLELTMSVSNEVQEFLNNSLDQNNVGLVSSNF